MKMGNMPSLGRFAVVLALLAAAPQAATAKAPGRHVRLDPAFLIGAWTDNGDCGNAVRFVANGRFIAANGGGGTWRLEGDRLTMSGDGVVAVRIVPIDRDTINVVNADGSRGRSTRCPAPPPEDAPVASDVT